MEQTLALLLHLKGKPLVGAFIGDDMDPVATAVNAARLHGHAQLVVIESAVGGEAESNVVTAKKVILALAVTDGEFEVEIKKISTKSSGTSGEKIRLDIYCRK